jgi:hypothetical protein
MSLCKCIQNFIKDEIPLFVEEKFYEYDYVPSIGERLSIYRVYGDNDRFHNFSTIDFSKYFKYRF